jgi:putative nucleotidyltransferase with HDIG domain
MAAAGVQARALGALAFAGALLGVGVVAVTLAPSASLVKPLTAILAIGAIASELFAANVSRTLRISGAFLATMLAVGFLGPVAAFAIPALTYVVVWLVERYRPQALVLNVACSATFAVLAAIALDQLTTERTGAGFVAALAGLSALTITTNLVVVSTLFALLDGQPVGAALRSMGEMRVAVAINVAIIAVVAGIYAELGTLALVFVLLNVTAFTYMTRLVITARERTREYASLSWGVLSGLIRTLDERDSRAARHCAAVAAFSRDIARQVGMSKREQEVAHTAGLLHDIGKFVLSDRVMERGGQLADADWRGVRRHPDIGAELLRDIGVYGPVAEIVRAHHERIDGRGYPRGLRGDEIPAVARIVAVAEVYDTLTAPDTYRTPMTSFEALTELRRVAGLQLDPVYVEALAKLLSGRGTDYRHADEADFDRELDLERRMNEAVARSS